MIQSYLIENTGSTARDFCFLERNILSHLKIALLLSLLSSSLLLRARLVPEKEPHSESGGGVPLAIIEFITAIACIVAGAFEYYSGYWDLRYARAFMAAAKSAPPYHDGRGCGHYIWHMSGLIDTRGMSTLMRVNWYCVGPWFIVILND
ncbi:hypothetical protein K443DRAFT_655500 [Laccaria amethystina LaAM-08-1]|uniref:Unplaced genomic scaffold K443scaffold_5, whole genome shotgun sequence n=1 Tax=Laccaria amethystina LaAM-08-1 TaxID=1095629 RepID=A0A0C9Y4I6_9AGAR|nr:hypothetical protein K443DRAFT_655500 [Laccaria amethystina LaAM-08-1]